MSKALRASQIHAARVAAERQRLASDNREWDKFVHVPLNKEELFEDHAWHVSRRGLGNDRYGRSR